MKKVSPNGEVKDGALPRTSPEGDASPSTYIDGACPHAPYPRRMAGRRGYNSNPPSGFAVRIRPWSTYCQVRAFARIRKRTA